MLVILLHWSSVSQIFVKNNTIDSSNSRKHTLLWWFLLNLFTFERFKMTGVSDVDGSLDVNELFRFAQMRLAVAGNLSNTFYGIYIMCLSLWNVYTEHLPEKQSINIWLTGHRATRLTDVSVGSLNIAEADLLLMVYGLSSLPQFFCHP